MLARDIAFIAHAGQTRADKVHPYFVHPERVAHLVMLWSGHLDLSMEELHIAIQAAYLHDVIEDTKVNRNDLCEMGILEEVLEIVDLLTLPSPQVKPYPPEYYKNIFANKLASIVKTADRYNNLEDAIKDVKLDGDPKGRWGRYGVDTANILMVAMGRGHYENMEWLYDKLEEKVQELFNTLGTLL